MCYYGLGDDYRSATCNYCGWGGCMCAKVMGRSVANRSDQELETTI